MALSILYRAELIGNPTRKEGNYLVILYGLVVVQMVYPSVHAHVGGTSRDCANVHCALQATFRYTSLYSHRE